MKKCCYYWVFLPLTQEDIIDDGSRLPALTVPIETQSGQYELSIFCDDHNQPWFARCIIPNLEKEELTKEAFPIIHNIKEHMLAVMAVTYRKDIAILPHTLSNFIDSDKPCSLNVRMQMSGIFHFQPEHVRNFFTGSFDMRSQLRLIVDGGDETIPLQYRFLSFYKLLEDNFKFEGQWKKSELESLINKFQNEFKQAGFDKPIRMLHEIRDQCAHIKTGKKKERLGVTQLNHSQSVQAQKYIKVLKKVCVDLINEKAAGKFVMGTNDN